jgi:hypothetical protein
MIRARGGVGKKIVTHSDYYAYGLSPGRITATGRVDIDGLVQGDGSSTALDVRSDIASSLTSPSHKVPEPSIMSGRAMMTITVILEAPPRRLDSP